MEFCQPVGYVVSLIRWWYERNGEIIQKLSFLMFKNYLGLGICCSCSRNLKECLMTRLVNFHIKGAFFQVGI